ncbi:MAG: Maf family protein [Clostridiales bacterium]|nr:Maf family protein [Clostridiales bacterium]
MNLVLASASPRRQELLALLDTDFIVKPADVDETLPEGIAPRRAVESLSVRKAEAVWEKNTCVIGADTVVALGQTIFGKPADAADARRMLNALSGRVHSVFTGVTVLHPDGRAETFSEETRVEFYPLSGAQVDAYIATGEPMDKAGAYGIQGRGCTLVKGIQGDYFNVVGLPVARLNRILFPAQL